MKNTHQVQLLIAALLLLPILSTTVVYAQASQEEKTALYTKFTENIKGDANQQKIAYEQGQEYVKKYGSDNDQYVAYIQKWMAKYEKATREVDFNKALNDKNYAKAFELGKLILTDGENFPVTVRLVQAGLLNAQTGNSSLNQDSIGFAKKALELVDSGKVTDPAPFKNLDDARGFLNFTQGWMLQEKSPAEAVPLLKKAAEAGGLYKTEPTTFVALGTSILGAEYEPLQKEYTDKFSGKDATPESEAMAAKLKGIGERVIDAYARAVALSTKPEQQEYKKKVLEDLTALYKQFHQNSDAGLNELIASVLSKPLP
jgi:hypothetical protein